VAINIYPRQGMAPIALGLSAYIGGKGEGMMQQAQMLHQSNMQQFAQTAQMTRQMVDAYSRTASQVLDHQNQVELHNLAHTQAIGLLDHRQRQALDLKTFTDTKMRLADVEQYAATAGPGGTPIPFHEAYAQLQQKNIAAEYQAKNLEFRFATDADRIEYERIMAEVNAMRSNPKWINPDGSWKPEGVAARDALMASAPKQGWYPRQKLTAAEMYEQETFVDPQLGTRVTRSKDGSWKPIVKPTDTPAMAMATKRGGGGGSDPASWPATMPDPLKAAVIQRAGGNMADVAAAEQFTRIGGIPYTVDPKTGKLTADQGYIEVAKAALQAAQNTLRRIDPETGVEATIDPDEFRRTYQMFFDALTGKPPSASAAPQQSSSKPVRPATPEQIQELREIAKSPGVNGAHARQVLKDLGL